MLIEREKTLRAIRLSVAIILTFLITWAFQIPEGTWALITCCFVLYEYTTLGGVLTKSYLRFLGTFLSAVYGALVVYFFANNPIIDILALVFGIFVNTYLFLDTKKTYSSVLGCVTLVLVLINYNQLDAAILRPFNVLLGEVISICTFRFVFPEYSRERVVMIQIDFVKNLCKILAVFVDNTCSLDEVKANYQACEKQLLVNMAGFSRYIEEAVMEVKKVPSIIEYHRDSMHHLKRIYHLISTFIYYIATNENRERIEVYYPIQTIVQYLSMVKAVMENPSKTIKSVYNNLPESIIQTQELFIVEVLFNGIFQELQALEKTWEKISMIRLSRYKIEDTSL